MEVVSTGQWTESRPGETNIEGFRHGAKVTVILEDAEPGSGPRLHWHPYGETWVVIEGRVAFTDGHETKEAGAGDVVYVGPTEPHRFRVLPGGKAKMVCIHQSEKFETNWLE